MEHTKNDIPQAVRNEVGEEYEIHFLCEYDNQLFYEASIPNEDTGFPIAIIYKNGEAISFNGFMALDIINSCQK